MKLRLDKVMVARGLAPTRVRAQQRISAGQVTVDGVIVTKSGFLVDGQQAIATLGEDLPYVGRGGVKLAAALDAWKIDVTGRVCLDVGISTGGFTDCLLQRGAASVTGIDSGHSQLAPVLRSDPRVRLLERTNARYLTRELLPAGAGFFVMDVSFIAASLVLPPVIAAAFPSHEERRTADPREAVVLVKPQYESGREFVGKRGIVRSDAAYPIAIERVRQTVGAHGARETRVMESPIAGGEGNREFLLYARF